MTGFWQQWWNISDMTSPAACHRNCVRNRNGRVRRGKRQWWMMILNRFGFSKLLFGFQLCLAGVELFHGFVPCAAPKNVCYAQVGGWEHNSLNTMCTTGSSRRVFGLLWRVPALQCKLKTKTNRITAAAARHPQIRSHSLSLAVSVGITLSSVAGERQRERERWIGQDTKNVEKQQNQSIQWNLI